MKKSFNIQKLFALQVQTSWNQAHAPLLVKSWPKTSRTRSERGDREWKQAQRQGDILDNSSTQKTKGGPKLGFVT
jgi:hypothetical protein